ncbi:hypothetical protein Btru_076126 [Bulinus truncatus]|nr:hypothetical protein Btru_076126 [Bulinus truncatus]
MQSISLHDLLVYVIVLHLLSFSTQECPVVIHMSRTDPPVDVWRYKPSREEIYDLTCLVITFISEDLESNLCIEHEILKTSTRDECFQLTLFDGDQQIVGPPGVINWRSRQWCSETNSIKFKFHLKNTFCIISPDELSNQVRVLHIESPYRKVVLDEHLCDDFVKFRDSRVEFSNKIEYSRENEPKSKCYIQIGKKNSDYKFCFYYKSQTTKGINFYWRIFISTIGYSLKPEGVIFSFDVNSNTTGVWCDESKRNILYIISLTNQTKYSPSDVSVFTMHVADFSGSQKSFTDFIGNTNLYTKNQKTDDVITLVLIGNTSLYTKNQKTDHIVTIVPPMKTFVLIRSTTEKSTARFPGLSYMWIVFLTLLSLSMLIALASMIYFYTKYILKRPNRQKINSANCCRLLVNGMLPPECFAPTITAP